MAYRWPSINSDKLLPFKDLWVALREEPALLDDPTCPYVDDVKRSLRAMFVREDIGRGVTMEDVVDVEELGTGAEGFDQVAKKAREIFLNLERIATHLKSDDVKEQIAVSKAMAQLLDRLLTIEERALNLKEMSSDMDAILGVVEEIMTPDQRTELMQRLDAK